MSTRNIAILTEEHRIIEYVLNALERMANKTATEHTVDVAIGRKVITFLREFADQCHHGKEEAILFKWLNARHIGMDAVAMLEDEHVAGRDLVVRMQRALDEFEKNKEIGSFADDANTFIAMLRDHIHKEDHGVFAMADGHIEAADDVRLIGDYLITERDGRRHQKALALAQDIGHLMNMPGFDISIIPELSKTFINSNHA
ncbi:MAG TPA: hemerythrin domain-containing protein [bacterium]|nr:hemerythrin domain-containing protein [bacterium]HMW33792.1 hemerythrin domain-containing protein [bacterium]HMY36935.1 hemerythrin domain-containing protein [bacterium]HMZ05612.1 hemerythrin domain-containing protein [bacterium]HNB09067.1 hemerythrin domain-containing protein [bacterium]